MGQNQIRQFFWRVWSRTEFVSSAMQQRPIMQQSFLQRVARGEKDNCKRFLSVYHFHFFLFLSFYHFHFFLLSTFYHFHFFLLLSLPPILVGWGCRADTLELTFVSNHLALHKPPNIKEIGHIFINFPFHFSTSFSFRTT